MKNNQIEEDLTGKELFSIMRLLQHLENNGEIPGDEEVDWQAVYGKLSYASYKATKSESGGS